MSQRVDHQVEEALNAVFSELGTLAAEYSVELFWLGVVGLYYGLVYLASAHSFVVAGVYTFLLVSVVLGIGRSLGDRPHLRLVRRSLDTSRVRRSWYRAVKHCGFKHPIPVHRIVRINAGYRARIKVGRGISFKDVEMRKEPLAASMAIKDVRVQRDPHNASTGTITFIRNDLLKDIGGTAWPGATAPQPKTRGPRPRFHRPSDDPPREHYARPKKPPKSPKGGGGNGGESLWDPIPIGQDEHMLPVTITLPEKSVLIGGIPGSGKALDVSTPVPTPDGWKTMGELQPGDQVFDEAGAVCTVTDAWAVRTNRPCYEVVFDDGSIVVADEDHQWVTETMYDRRQQSNESRRKRQTILPPRILEELRSVAAEDDDTTLPELMTRVEGFASSASFYHVAKAVPSHEGTAVIRRYGGRTGTSVFRRSVRCFHKTQLANALIAHGSRLLWDQRPEKRPITTQEIRDTLRRSDDLGANHSIPCAGVLAYERKRLLVPPYALGCWLGDGTTNSDGFCAADLDGMEEHLRAEGIELVPQGRRYGYWMRYAGERSRDAMRICPSCNDLFIPKTRNQIYCASDCAPNSYQRIKGLPRERRFRDDLKKIGVLPDKHIPEQYLRASEDQRRALLAGLMDTDGTVGKAGDGISFCSTRESLARGFYQLVISLGYKARISTRRVKGRTEQTSTAYDVSFSPSEAVFSLRRKQKRQAGREPRTTARRRFITDVRNVPSRPVRCIAVNSPSHQFLVGESCIATHNSAAMSMMLARAALDRDVRLYLIDGKEVELQYWEKCAEEVAYTIEEAIALLQILQRRLTERLKELRRHDIRTVASRPGELPLYAFFIDELAFFTANPDKKLAQEFTSSLTSILTRGRAAGIIPVAATQKPEGAVVPTSLRDLFVYRLALRCSTPEASDTILGRGWAGQGFDAKTIPPGNPGVGFLLAEDGIPQRIRTHYLNDEAIRTYAEQALQGRQA